MLDEARSADPPVRKMERGLESFQLEAIHPPPCGVVLTDWQVRRHSWWGFGRSVDGFDKLRTLSA